MVSRRKKTGFGEGGLLEVAAQHGWQCYKSFARRAILLTVISRYDVVFLYCAATLAGPLVFEHLLKMSSAYRETASP